MVPPQAVLAEALRESLGEATLRSAVLTTFTLEWAFTLDEVLPTFIPETLSAAPNARREELASHLLKNQAVITIYADHRHIGDPERGTRVPLSVVPVRHPTGFFHPKVVLALVESEGAERLVVSAGSANLTRGGWWEWVECAQVVTIAQGAATWMRDDLLSFLQHLDRQSIHPSDRLANAAVRKFLRANSQRSNKSSTDADGIVRFLWNGASGRPELGDELTRRAGRKFEGGRLDVVSPWYSDTGDAVLTRLSNTLTVDKTVAFVPEDPDGAALVPAEAVKRLGKNVEWGSLPRRILSSGPAADAAPRHVHAKLYRLTVNGSHEQVILAGSFNLTGAAFQSAGNLEAGLLLELPWGGKDVWLEPRDAPTQFHAIATEEEAAEVTATPLSPLGLQYDWPTRRASAEWASGEPPSVVALRQGSVLVLTLEQDELSSELTDDKSAVLRTHLRSSSPFLSVVGPDGADLGYTIVHETGVESKPSPDVDRRLRDVLADLLLDAEARRARASVSGGGDDIDADREVRDQDEAPHESVFDSHAALYQAMDAFRRELVQLVADKRPAEIRHRLTGEYARCLGDVLTTAEASLVEDAGLALVVCWAVEDLMAVTSSSLKKYKAEVTLTLSRAEKLRKAAEIHLLGARPDDPEMERFLNWARTTFVREQA